MSTTQTASDALATAELLSYEEQSHVGDPRKLIRSIAWGNIIIGGASFIGSITFAAAFTLGKFDAGYSSRSFSMELFGSETVGIISSIVGMITSLVIVVAALAALRGASVATLVLAVAPVVPAMQSLLGFVSFRLHDQISTDAGSAYEIAMMVHDNISGLVWIAPSVALAIINFAAFKASRGR